METILNRKIMSEEQTKMTAKKFFTEHLADAPKYVVYMEGGLGVGKTTFIREVLRLYGVEGNIASPTYTYVQEYDGARGDHIAHFDLYRLPEPAEFHGRGFEEIAGDASCWVEWPDKIDEETKKSFSGGDIYIIRMKHGVGASMREIRILKK